MSAQFTSDWLASREARTKTGPKAPPSAYDGPERAIHEQIIAECKRRAWRCVHSRMDRPSTVGEGVCDFIIYADAGRMFNVEVKTKTGKLSIEQQSFITWLDKLGHRVHVVYSFGEFLDLIDHDYVS